MSKKNNVWCITEIDKYGKIVMGYKSIKDLPVNKKQTLGEYIEQNELEKLKLRRDVNILKKALGEVIKTFGGVEE